MNNGIENNRSSLAQSTEVNIVDPPTIQKSEIEKPISNQVKSIIDRESFDIQVSIDNLSSEEKQNLLNALKLPENTTLEHLRIRIKNHLEVYYQKVEEINRFLTEQIPAIKNYLAKNGLIPHQNPEDIPIYVTDHILEYLVDTEFTSSIFSEGEYLPQKEAIRVAKKDVVPHELFHAMSHNKEKRTLGFYENAERNEHGELIGNVWLDEGTVMLGEYDVYPIDSREISEEEDDGLYTQGYLFLTKLFQQELQVSTLDLQKAHFKQEPEYSQLVQKVRERFNCTIAELDCLFLGFNEESQEQMTSLLNGQSVTLTYVDVEGSNLGQKFRKLQNIFPTLTVEVVQPPTIKQ